MLEQKVLENGLRVLVQENHAAKVVALQVWVRVGSADEQPPEAGLAHVHEHMLFKGTERRKVGEIASAVEGAGGDINAWTSYDQTVYHVTMASRDFDIGLDILADAVQHSTFDPAELGRELEVVLEELKRGNDTPSRVVAENLFKTAYQVHPYSRPIIGYVESVKSFTREMIVDFYRRWYRPRNMCLVVVGDVVAKDVFARAAQLFEPDQATRPLPERPRTPEPPQRELRIVRAAQAVQESHLTAAWHGTPFKHDDTPALDVLSVLLGSGESSRLQRVIRRQLELVNDAYAFAYTPQDAGLISVGATTADDRIEDAFRALLKETLRLKYEEPALSEVEKARTILLSEAVYQKETVQGIARKIGFYAASGDDPSYEEIYYARIREVRPEDVLAVAQKYLRPDGMTVSVLLPEARRDRLDEATIRTISAEVESELRREYHSPAIQIGKEQIAKVRLSNGSTLLVREDHAVALVSVRAQTKGGLLADEARTAGATHLMASLLTRGTRRYSAEQISEQSDATASGLGGSAGRNSVSLRGDFLKEFWGQGFELFCSCLLEPEFDPKELERERRLQLEDIASREDHLSALCFDRLAEALWTRHPYRLAMIGTKTSVEALDRASIVAAYERQLRPDRLVISVVGAVAVAEVVDRFERRVGSIKLPEGAPAFELPPREPELAETRTTRIARPKEQAHLALGFPGFDLYDERRYPLEVLCSVLGGQGGRLFLELRDKQSLCYSVSAFSIEGLAPGYFAVYIGTAPDKLEAAESGIRRELKKMIDAEPSAEEVERAQRYLIGAHDIALQRASARATTIGLSELYGLGYDEYTRYAERIGKVTARQVKDVARDIIRFERAARSIVDVGPEK